MEAADEEAPVSRLARLGLWLGPVLAAAVWLGLAAIGLKAEATRLAAITALMATWWMTEAAPVAVTAVLPLVLFPWLGVSPAKSVAPNYGHDLIWLFFGGFQLAFAIERRGLHRRIALFLVRLIGTRADRLVLGFMLAAGLLSMWLLNTSTTLMMLPIGLSVLTLVVDRSATRQDASVGKELQEGGRISDVIDDPNIKRFGVCLVLAIAWAASMGAR